MFVGITDIFKIGIGPSSSHTMGPMSAACRFMRNLETFALSNDIQIHKIQASLHGSLAFTGRGHASDRAVALGLMGFEPADLEADRVADYLQALAKHQQLHHPKLGMLAFNPEQDLIFDFETSLAGHANGMQFFAYDAASDAQFHEIYYSIGGGFIRRSDEMGVIEKNVKAIHPYPFTTAAEMLEMGDSAKLSIAQMQRENELSYRNAEALDTFIQMIWQTMESCIERGLQADGILPGGLEVRRRAKHIVTQLYAESSHNQQQPHIVNDWLSVYAMAVNEENADGGQIVTAPTNGAAGVVPAVMRYYRTHCHGVRQDGVSDFLLTAAAIGSIIKINASISGAEVGCQGEVGSASAMAAAGLCAALGGTNAQIENAAEIALEHHLGMTCDPAGGLVQVPCIERNGLGAIKAVSAASLALRGDGKHLIPLDNCIETMRQTGLDMHQHYKETSQGGLAVNLPEC